MEVEGAQQGGGRLAAGGGGAAVGDGGVGSLERSGVFERRHRDGCPGPRLCRWRQTVSCEIMGGTESYKRDRVAQQQSPETQHQHN